MKQEIIEKEYKNNLKEHSEQKLVDLIYKLKKTERGQELTTMQIREMLSQKSVAGASPKYSNTELAIVFDYYRQCINEINKYKMYLPTKKNFCSFAGISSSQYDNWRKSQDDERADIMQKIDDYITDIQLTSAQNGDIKEISTIYRTKSEHGMVEATAPIVVEHKSEVNTANILKQIEALKKGQSLIELKEQPDGTYRVEDNE